MLSKAPQLTSFTLLKGREDWIQKGPRLSSFWLPRNLSYHMGRQARTGDTMSVKTREMTGRAQTLPWWLGGRRGKDDRKQNTFAPLPKRFLCVLLKRIGRAFRKLLRVFASFPKWVLGVPQKLQYLKETFITWYENFYCRDVSIFRVKRSHTGTNIRGCKPVTVYFQKYEDKEEILRYFRIRIWG